MFSLPQRLGAFKPASAGPAARPRATSQRLRAALTRGAAPASTPAAPAAAPAEGTFITAEEAALFSPAQQAFLTRKRKAALGLGPAMPPECSCAACEGIGNLVCPQCGGSGRNASDKAEELFQNEHEVIKTNNGLLDPRWLMVQGGPCWLCRGRQDIACPDCSGTGIKGGVDRYTGD